MENWKEWWLHAAGMRWTTFKVAFRPVARRVWRVQVSLGSNGVIHLSGKLPLPFSTAILKPYFDLCFWKFQQLWKLHSAHNAEVLAFLELALKDFYLISGEGSAWPLLCFYTRLPLVLTCAFEDNMKLKSISICKLAVRFFTIIKASYQLPFLLNGKFECKPPSMPTQTCLLYSLLLYIWIDKFFRKRVVGNSC